VVEVFVVSTGGASGTQADGFLHPVWRHVVDGESIGQILKSIAALIAFAVIVGVYVLSIGWVYHDANNRGKSGCLVALIVMLLSWPFSLIAWVVFRPDDPDL
jgi:hypothetical protein